MSAVTSPDAARRPRRVPRLLLVHAAVVLVLSVLLLVMVAQPTEDANIGAGLALLAVLPFGLPWSLPLVLFPGAWPVAAQVGLAIGTAALNVVLLALLRAHLRRRRAARAGTTAR